tara:strand:- start:27 stop:308 length:282 start_codon:yes stop_codon:yes gene_type:complete
MNKMTNKNFDIVSSVSHQLPHFSCINIIFDKKYQRDISKYLYCKEFSVPPFKGSYEDQPYKWIQKVNIIQHAIAKRNEMERVKIKNSIGANNG